MTTACDSVTSKKEVEQGDRRCRIQRRATKLIPELKHVSYEIRLLEYRSTTLEIRRLRGDLMEVFKILNGYEDIDSNIFSN